MTLVYHPEFSELTQYRIAEDCINRRVSFQFTVSGTLRSGVDYVNMNIEPGMTLQGAAEKAAARVCKRAGASEAKLWRVTGAVSGR